jgi:hypothetical protein
MQLVREVLDEIRQNFKGPCRTDELLSVRSEPRLTSGFNPSNCSMKVALWS